MRLRARLAVAASAVVCAGALLACSGVSAQEPEAEGLTEVMQADTVVKVIPLEPVVYHLRFASAFLASISMIIVSEFGDKTFFIAAIMAMKHNRLEVFASAIAALALMTVLSAGMGQTLPAVLDPKITHYMATALFFFFGAKLIWDAWGMEAGGDLKEELEEVEEELAAKETEEGAASVELLPGGVNSSAAGSARPSSPLANASASLSLASRRVCASWTKFFRRFFSKVFIQCFSMTFLAEWGDRSQIATIALAAQKDAFGVTMGGIIGHALCTGVAVLGGKLLATRISERTICLTGGLLFLIFGVHSVYYGEEH